MKIVGTYINIFCFPTFSVKRLERELHISPVLGYTAQQLSVSKQSSRTIDWYISLQEHQTSWSVASDIVNTSHEIIGTLVIGIYNDLYIIVEQYKGLIAMSKVGVDH